MKVRQIIERLREGESGRARLVEDAANVVAKRMPVQLRRAAIVNAAIRATQEHVVGSRGYAGPDGLEYAMLMDHAGTPLADEMTPDELAEAQAAADRAALNDRLEAGGADTWAEEFARLFHLDLTALSFGEMMVGDRETFILDRGTLIGWFANAMERGRQMQRAEQAFPRNHFDHLHFTSGARRPGLDANSVHMMVFPNMPYEQVYGGEDRDPAQESAFFDRLGAAFAAYRGGAS